MRRLNIDNNDCMHFTLTQKTAYYGEIFACAILIKVSNYENNEIFSLIVNARVVYAGIFYQGSLLLV